MVIIDPGPDVDDHVRALASRAARADEVAVVLTHGHRDHAGATDALVRALDAPVFGPAGVEGVTRPLADGEVVESDAGVLRAVHTPGHTRDHLCFHWEARSALFAGDLILGKGETTWVAEYPGCVADYLDSLERVRTLDVTVIYPAHGPPLVDPTAALDRFEQHRRGRIRQVEAALAREPEADLERLLDIVYGPELPSGLRRHARQSLGALMDFVRGAGG